MKNRNFLKKIELEFKSIKDQIIKTIDPEKIILFGSFASENISIRSDIDLLIIKDTDKSFKERMYEIYQKIDYKLPTDMLVYTSEEIKRLKDKNMFLKHILNTGKVVYEKNNYPFSFQEKGSRDEL